jgi:26S proteasome regulatory subunit N9
MSQAVVTNYLSEQKRTTDKELAEEWGIMEELYNEK